MPAALRLEETVSELQTSGITFCVQYVGSVIVEKSMNTLGHERQAEVARACMRFVVREAMPTLGASEPDEAVTNTYVHGPVLSHGGDVEMNVSTSAIILIDCCSFRVLNRFKIPDVSVLSPGSDELALFFCFVAKVPGKDGKSIRKCFVFKASEESVLEDVRDMICFAFRLHANANKKDANIIPVPQAKIPSPSNVPSAGQICSNLPEIRISSSDTAPELPPRQRRSLTDTDHPPINNLGGIVQQQRQGRRSVDQEQKSTAANSRAGTSSNSSRSDCASPRQNGPQISPARYKEITRDLDHQSWYHGIMPRMTADKLVHENGQFLVRRSPNIEDQFVLVGIHDGKHRHVCLIGSGGKILTTIGEFKSIVHLIDYFHRSRQPLVLQEIQLVLHSPVHRPQSSAK